MKAVGVGYIDMCVVYICNNGLEKCCGHINMPQSMTENNIGKVWMKIKNATEGCNRKW